MKKRIGAAIMAGVLAASFALVGTGCSSTNYQPELKQPVINTPTIKQAGTLRVGVDTNKSPLAGKGNDKIIGIDVDIAAAIADELGLKLSIVETGSDPQAAIDEGRVDIVMGVDGSETDAGFWLSSEYLPTAIALFAKPGTKEMPTKGSSTKIAAQVSSKSAWAVSNEYGDASLESATNLGDAFNQLEADKVKYVASDAIIGLYAAHRQGVDVSIIALMSKPSGYCVGVSLENKELQDQISDVLKTLTSNGIIDVIEKKWLGASLNLKDMQLTAGAVTASAISDSQKPAEGDGAEGEGAEGQAAEGEGAEGEASASSSDAAAA